MGTITITINSSLDGVVQDPDGTESIHTTGWVATPGTPNGDAWAKIEADEAHRAQSLLLGRRSYQWLSSRWQPRHGPWADRLNTIPKFVVSSTLTDQAATWGPTTILRDDPIQHVTRLKEATDGDIVVYASSQLTPTLIEHNLVDQLHVFIHPWILGTGTHLPGNNIDRTRLQLRSSTTVGDDLVQLIYTTSRPESDP